jgi:light-regulated signal transduction histidine kinase (bacteriophytochrome)/ActR/RegA family two-component response regulator
MNQTMQEVAASEVADDYLDSTDHIAYQYSNLIQPHVLFLNVDRHERLILNVSTNVCDWLATSAQEIVGKPLDDDLFPGITEVLLECEQRHEAKPSLFSHHVQGPDGKPQLCRVFATPTRWMVELENAVHPCSVEIDGQRLERLVLEATQALSNDVSIHDLVTQVSASLRELLGFERGMCYQFDDENNGEVIAEATSSPDTLKYFGLRFPSRDIPRTAREMLLSSPIRATIDQQQECSEIFPRLDPHTHHYVDLTHVRGRGAAGSCREYYLNMNIRSTLVLPLIVERRLWGLLSFHDHEVRLVSPLFDQHLLAIAQCLSISIERNLRASREQARKRGTQVVAELSEVDPISDQWLDYIQNHTNVLKDLIPCDGLILRLSGHILSAGSVPAPEDIESFTNAVLKLTNGKPLQSNCLDQLSHDLGKHSDVAAGLIAVPLSVTHNDIAIWIRANQKQVIQWAGDPLGNIDTDSVNQKRLCVRESFDVWLRVTERKCLPWTEQDRCIATSAAMQIGLLALSWHAAQASQAKTQFLSCMSHEIRTPMTAILGYADLLKEQHQSAIESSQSTDFIDVIERNGMHLLSVIDDILNVAKIESGKLTVEQIPVSVPDLLLDVVALVKVQTDAKNLELKLELGTPIPSRIDSDVVRLRQILINLLGNAVKFTEHGSVTLRVSHDEAQPLLVFEVIDTGIGLTESQMGRLFNAFSQADASTTRRFGGSGLGLNISKNLAQLLGGDITIQSQPGVGSIFRVTIASSCSSPVDWVHDLNRSKPGNIDDASVATEATHAQPISLAGMRIMLLEDGVDNQRLLRHLLTKAGAEVSVFGNGKLGIESLTVDGRLEGALRTPFPYDIVLTDMQMPELDGYATVRLLREKGCTTPLIALTAFAMQGSGDECLSVGCDDYLSKPLTRDALLAICSKWRTATLSHQGC